MTSTTFIRCIWTAPLSDPSAWSLFNAWHEWDLDGWPEGFDKDIEKASKEGEPCHVRVQDIMIPFESVDVLFRVPTIEGKPEGAQTND